MNRDWGPGTDSNDVDQARYPFADPDAAPGRLSTLIYVPVEPHRGYGRNRRYDFDCSEEQARVWPWLLSDDERGGGVARFRAASNALRNAGWYPGTRHVFYMPHPVGVKIHIQEFEPEDDCDCDECEGECVGGDSTVWFVTHVPPVDKAIRDLDDAERALRAHAMA